MPSATNTTTAATTADSLGPQSPSRRRSTAAGSAAVSSPTRARDPASVFSWLGDVAAADVDNDGPATAAHTAQEGEIISAQRESTAPAPATTTAQQLGVGGSGGADEDVKGFSEPPHGNTGGGGEDTAVVVVSGGGAAAGGEEATERDQYDAAPMNGGAEDDDDDESVESDYYYDDAGVSHTYYRPRRFPHRHSSGQSHHAHAERLASAAPFGDNTTANGGGGPLDDDVHSSNAPHRPKASYPEDNGSIYIAPPSVRHLGPSSATASRLHTNRSFCDDNSIATTTTMGAVAGGPRRRRRRGVEAGEDGVEMDGTINNGGEDYDAATTGAPGGGIAPYTDNKSIVALPDNLRHIGHRLDKLPVEELLYISAMVSRKANREVYSILQYSGEAWYLPEVRRTRPGEKRWELMYYWGVGLIVTLRGRRIRFRLLSYMLRLSIMALIWFIVWSSTIPKSWSYRTLGYFLGPYTTILASAILGGIVCRLLNIPPLVGVLWTGIMWNNIGPEVGWLTAGILPEVRTITSRSGLTIIALRAGYSISIRAVQPLIGNVLLNASTLGVETIAHALMANFYLNYNDWKWSFCQGIICSVQAAAIVVPGVLLLQAEGYSRGSGPLPLMLATMGIETPVGVWGANFLFGLISSDQSIGYLAGMCPVQLFGGAACGIVAFGIMHLFVWILRNEANRLPTGRYSDAHMANVYPMVVFVLLLAGHAMMFLSYEIEMAGGGVVATLVMTFCLANFWAKDNDPEWLDMKANVGSRLASVWDLAAMPYLFSIAGSKIVLSKVFNRTQFPKALLVIAVSVGARFISTGFGSLGLGFTWKERLFHMGAATSKATLQIAMGGSPLDYISKKLAGTPATDVAARELLGKQLEMAEMFQTTSVLSVLICAPLAAIWITRLGPWALKKE